MEGEGKGGEKEGEREGGGMSGGIINLLLSPSHFALVQLRHLKAPLTLE